MKLIRNLFWAIRVKSELSYEAYKLRMNDLFLRRLQQEVDIEETKTKRRETKNEIEFLEKKKLDVKEKIVELQRLEKIINTFEERKDKLDKFLELARHNEIYQSILRNVWWKL
jgi:hypothetical protein